VDGLSSYQLQRSCRKSDESVICMSPDESLKKSVKMSLILDTRPLEKFEEIPTNCLAPKNQENRLAVGHAPSLE
jgi:hypothetical protein